MKNIFSGFSGYDDGRYGESGVEGDRGRIGVSDSGINGGGDGKGDDGGGDRGGNGSGDNGSAASVGERVDGSNEESDGGDGGSDRGDDDNCGHTHLLPVQG